MISTSIINRVATEEGVDPKLVAAFIQVESSNNEFAWRTESAYRYLWDVKTNKPFRALHQAEANNEVAPSDFFAAIGSRNTEWLGQQASWGPMQVMGAVAREFKFKGHFPELCGEAGVRIGCQLLRKLLDRYHAQYGNEGVAAAYNAGSPKLIGKKFANQEYVDKIMSAYGGQ